MIGGYNLVAIIREVTLKVSKIKKKKNHNKKFSKAFRHIVSSSGYNTIFIFTGIVISGITGKLLLLGGIM